MDSVLYGPQQHYKGTNNLGEPVCSGNQPFHRCRAYGLGVFVAVMAVISCLFLFPVPTKRLPQSLIVTSVPTSHLVPNPAIGTTDFDVARPLTGPIYSLRGPIHSRNSLASTQRSSASWGAWTHKATSSKSSDLGSRNNLNHQSVPFGVTDEPGVIHGPTDESDVIYGPVVKGLFGGCISMLLGSVLYILQRYFRATVGTSSQTATESAPRHSTSHTPTSTTHTPILTTHTPTPTTAHTSINSVILTKQPQSKQLAHCQLHKQPHTQSQPQSSHNDHTSIPCTLKHNPLHLSRRAALSRGAAAGAAGLAAAVLPPAPAHAAITKESEWPLWPALPVAPYSRRKTICNEVGAGVWAFDQLIGIYYVHVPIRMTVIRLQSGGLFVYAPVAPTQECLALLQPLIDEHGPVKYIVLPSVAVEHKVNAGPFARKFPKAEFYAVDQQYSFPIPLPSSFLGLPSWTKPLPRSSEGMDMWGGELEHEVLTVKPGPGSYFQDVAFVHKPSRTVLICDALLAVTEEPPPILTSEPEYTRALLFHARDDALEVVEDSPEARRKGWRRIVLLFNFFIPGATQADIGLKPLLALDPKFEFGWGGWQPFAWRDTELASFEKYSMNGKPTLLPIIQIILNRGVADGSLIRWVRKVQSWDFERVVPAHLDAPLAIGPSEFGEPFDFARNGGNEVRFCDEDIALLRQAELGPLNFSVSKTDLGPLTGTSCNLGNGNARVVSDELNLRWTPK